MKKSFIVELSHYQNKTFDKNKYRNDSTKRDWDKKCNYAPKSHPKFDPDLHICFGENPDRIGQSTCDGDSGGPLFPYGEHFYPICIYGVTSHGPTKCPGPASIFTRVSYYADWRNRTMQELS